jgi:hypothetical protein
MNKTFLTICAIIIVACFSQSCIKNADCKVLVNNIDSTHLLYINDSTKCSTYKATLDEWLASTCASTHTPAKDGYIADLAALPCK